MKTVRSVVEATVRIRVAVERQVEDDAPDEQIREWVDLAGGKLAVLVVKGQWDAVSRYLLEGVGEPPDRRAAIVLPGSEIEIGGRTHSLTEA